MRRAKILLSAFFVYHRQMKNLTIIILLFSSFMLTSCGRFSNKQNENSGEKRIVCVSKQLTEIIFALGAEKNLAGIDLSSTYPPETAKIPTVGYHRALGAEGIISLKPTAVYDNEGMGPEAVKEQLKKVGIPIVEYSPTPDIESTIKLIKTLGKEFGVESRADSVCSKLESDMQQVFAQQKTFTTYPKVLLIHFGLAMNMYFVVGNRGNANDMIQWAGGINGADTSGFKMLSPEFIAKIQPDVILATDFGFDRAGGIEGFKQLPGIALTPAAKNNKIFRVEEHDLIYFGPRTGENVLKLGKLIRQ